MLAVFIFKSDVGFGTIVGSAVFNVLFVIGLCAYFSGMPELHLTWYALGTRLHRPPSPPGTFTAHPPRALALTRRQVPTHA